MLSGAPPRTSLTTSRSGRQNPVRLVPPPALSRVPAKLRHFQTFLHPPEGRSAHGAQRLFSRRAAPPEGSGTGVPKAAAEGVPGHPCSVPGDASPLTVRADTGFHAGGKFTRWGKGRGAAARAPGQVGSFIPSSTPGGGTSPPREPRNTRETAPSPRRGDRNATHPTPRPPRAPPPPPPGAQAPAPRGPAAAASPACAATWRDDRRPERPTSHNQVAELKSHPWAEHAGPAIPLLGGPRRFITSPDG